MAKHLLTTPHGADLRHALHGVGRLMRPGRHAAADAPTHPHEPASWSGTHAGAARPLGRLPVRPRPSWGHDRGRVVPVERPDLDVLRRVLVALYRL